MIKTDVRGDRSVFGYLGEGDGLGSGQSSVRDTLAYIEEEYSDYEWKGSRWNGDDMILEFERREGTNQLIETVRLRPEAYSEFLVLKKWEKDHGFL